jgi:hypothetical protein
VTHGDTSHLSGIAELEALPAVISVIAASKILGIGKNQSYELIKYGRYPVRVLQLNGRYRISKFDLLAYLGVPGYERPDLTRELAS